MKSKYDKISSEVYWLAPDDIVSHGLQVNPMSRDNCFACCPERKSLPLKDRQVIYDELSAKIRESGFSAEHPIRIMLNRDGEKDKILDGHHRLSIAKDIGATKVPVRFVYATKAK